MQKEAQGKTVHGVDVAEVCKQMLQRRFMENAEEIVHKKMLRKQSIGKR